IATELTSWAIRCQRAAGARAVAAPDRAFFAELGVRHAGVLVAFAVRAGLRRRAGELDGLGAAVVLADLDVQAVATTHAGVAHRFDRAARLLRRRPAAADGCEQRKPQ